MSECNFLLDTNILLTAYHRYYAFDLVPSFWVRLGESAEKNRWAIIDYVRDELIRQDDQISHWIQNKYSGQILDSSTHEVLRAYRKVINSVQGNEQYTPNAKQEFARIADSWIVAHGLATDLCIVTEEKFERDVKKRVMIPNECKTHSISCINTFDFMRRIGLVRI